MAEEKPSGSSSPLMMMMFMLLMMFILFDPRIRAAMGMALDPVLTPVLGFGYHFPLITVFLASVSVVLLMLGTFTHNQACSLESSHLSIST